MRRVCSVMQTRAVVFATRHVCELPHGKSKRFNGWWTFPKASLSYVCTKRTSMPAVNMSALGGKADIPSCRIQCPLLTPKRTLASPREERDVLLDLRHSSLVGDRSIRGRVCRCVLARHALSTPPC